MQQRTGDVRFFSPPPSPHKNGAGAQDTFRKAPFIIGVTGGTASGKTTVCQGIIDQLGQTNLDSHQKQVVMISQDSFYRKLTPQEKERADRGQFNFDHPDAFDTERMKKVFMDILDGKTVEVPIYNFRTHCGGPETRTIYPTDVVLFEGILVLYDREIREMMNMKLFVDTDSDTRLARRVVRDINERGRKLDQVLEQYTDLVKPAFEEFTLPTKKYADVIIPRGSENQVAIDLIVQHIRDILVGSISYYHPFNRWQRKPRVRRESDSYLVRPH